MDSTLHKQILCERVGGMCADFTGLVLGPAALRMMSLNGSVT